jgi:hypothetical protein
VVGDETKGFPAAASRPTTSTRSLYFFFQNGGHNPCIYGSFFFLKREKPGFCIYGSMWSFIILLKFCLTNNYIVKTHRVNTCINHLRKQENMMLLSTNILSYDQNAIPRAIFSIRLHPIFKSTYFFVGYRYIVNTKERWQAKRGLAPPSGRCRTGTEQRVCLCFAMKRVHCVPQNPRPGEVRHHPTTTPHKT